jgi:hypothetical protein
MIEVREIDREIDHRWDDRTIHCNGPGVGEGDTGTQLSRAAAYITFTPRSKASEDVLRLRQLMHERHKFTGHACVHIGGSDIKQSIREMEALPVWQEGDTFTHGTTGVVYNIAKPAALNDYQRSLIG